MPEPVSYDRPSSAPAPMQRGPRRAGARATAAPGPSSRGDVTLEAADGDRGDARVLPAHEVGRRRGLVGDRDPGGVQLAPVGVGAPAPVLQRPQPGDADRDVDLPVAPGAAERVADDDGRAARAARRAGAGRSRRGRAAGSRAGPAPPAFDASTPAFAQTNPWWVRQIRTPCSARTSSALWSSTTCTCARVLAVLGGELERARRRASTSREVGDRALGLRDDLVGDARARRRGRARPRRRPASSAARSSPGRTSGSACECGDLQRGSSRAPRGSARRACRRPCAAARPRAPARAPRGPRACRRRAAARAAR